MNSVIVFVNIFAELLQVAIIIRIVFSWINVDKDSRIYQFIRDISEPILAPFQRIIPRLWMIDFSPIVALLALDLARGLLIQILLAF